MKLAYPFALAFWDASDPFGNWPLWRRALGYGPHRGDDWKPGNGVRIPASGAGRIRMSFWNNVLGWVVVVEYDLYPGVYFGYCHMFGRSTRGVGSRVALGETLGLVGNTGSASLGPHLHLTASRTLGDPGTVPVINPMQFFGLNTNTAGGGISPLPTPEQSEEDDMLPLYITDSVDGNNVPGWALLNPRTGKLVTLRNTGKQSEQDQANVWGAVWGSAKRVDRNAMLTAIDAINKTK